MDRRTMPHVMVLSSEGYFYLYSIDLEKGGECSLMKQYKCVSLLSVAQPFVLIPCPHFAVCSIPAMNRQAWRIDCCYRKK
jgi:hypothetical protein